MNIRFFCIGAQKSGTTSLHDILSAHPEIELPVNKETQFFSNEALYGKGIDYYLENYFGSKEDCKIYGEIDPDYLFTRETPERLFQTFGSSLKFILLLRNPADRAYSNYLMEIARGEERKDSFEDAIFDEINRKINTTHDISHRSYISRGKYAEQLKRFLVFFPISQFLILRFEDDFLDNKVQTVKKILEFLDVDDEIKLPLDIKSNIAKAPRWKLLHKLTLGRRLTRKFGLFIPKKVAKQIKNVLLDLNYTDDFRDIKLSSQVRHNLIKEYFLDDIRELQELTSINFSSWTNADFSHKAK